LGRPWCGSDYLLPVAITWKAPTLDIETWGHSESARVTERPNLWHEAIVET